MERHARFVTVPTVESARTWFSAQKIAGYGVAAIAAVFVLYPVYFLLQAAFDVGDPQVRPPTAYGFDNFSGLLAPRGRVAFSVPHRFARSLSRRSCSPSRLSYLISICLISLTLSLIQIT